MEVLPRRESSCAWVVCPAYDDHFEAVLIVTYVGQYMLHVQLSDNDIHPLSVMSLRLYLARVELYCQS